MNEDHNPRNQAQKALQRFVIANTDLDRLEALARRFNMFEARGVVRAERRHSNFLGFLLNPKERHGLRDRFLKRFLQRALEIEPTVASLSPLELALLDLSNADVRVEHDDIDVLVWA